MKTQSNWDNYQWQLIHVNSQEPALHMALDEQITHEVGIGLRWPTLRIWEWNSSAVVIGRFQSLRNEVNFQIAKDYDIKVVRRISGGGAMFIEPRNSITYSLSIPYELVYGMSFQDSYKFLESWVLKSLRDIGIRVWHKPLNDIVSNYGKIGGSAQARSLGAILHHTSLSYDIDEKKMNKVLRIGKEKISDKGITSAIKLVSPLRSQTNMSREAIIQHMIKTFSNVISPLKIVEIGNKTLEHAHELCRRKFNTIEWLKLIA